MLVYAYVLSNPHRLSEGLYELPAAYVSRDLDMTTEEILQAFDNLERERAIMYDRDAEVIFDRYALTLLPPKSPKQLEGAIRKLRGVPRTPLRAELWKAATIHVPLLADAMFEAFPELGETDETAGQKQSPDTPVTLNQDSRDTPETPELEIGSYGVGLRGDDRATPLLRAQLERAEKEGDTEEVERLRSELGASA